LQLTDFVVLVEELTTVGDQELNPRLQ